MPQLKPPVTQPSVRDQALLQGARILQRLGQFQAAGVLRQVAHISNEPHQLVEHCIREKLEGEYRQRQREADRLFQRTLAMEVDHQVRIAIRKDRRRRGRSRRIKRLFIRRVFRGLGIKLSS